MSIYSTTDYREAIVELVDRRKKAEPKVNYAYLAAKLGIQKTYLSRVVHGQRDLTSDQMHAIARFFDLEERGIDYLLLLLEYARTGYAWRKRDLHKKITQIQARERDIKKNLAAENLEPLSSQALTAFYADPMNSVVHHFFDLPDGRNQPARIAQALGLTGAQMTRIIDTLLAAGIIRRDARKGTYSVAREHIHLDHDSAVSLSYLVALRHLAAQHIQRIPKNDKMTFSVTFSADEKARVKIHECFLEFLRQIEPIARAAPSEDIYQINFDLFAWSSSI